jgi:hypothetical protein
VRRKQEDDDVQIRPVVINGQCLFSNLVTHHPNH